MFICGMSLCNKCIQIQRVVAVSLFSVHIAYGIFSFEHKFIQKICIIRWQPMIKILSLCDITPVVETKVQECYYLNDRDFFLHLIFHLRTRNTSKNKLHWTVQTFPFFLTQNKLPLRYIGQSIPIRKIIGVSCDNHNKQIFTVRENVTFLNVTSFCTYL